jgi:hypothetical protein
VSVGMSAAGGSHRLCTAAMVLMPISAPIKALV